MISVAVQSTSTRIQGRGLASKWQTGREPLSARQKLQATMNSSRRIRRSSARISLSTLASPSFRLGLLIGPFDVGAQLLAEEPASHAAASLDRFGGGRWSVGSYGVSTNTARTSADSRLARRVWNPAPPFPIYELRHPRAVIPKCRTVRCVPRSASGVQETFESGNTARNSTPFHHHVHILGFANW